MTATAFWPARRLVSAIRRRKISAVELLELYLERVAAHNPALNAIVVTDLEGARARAKAADEALARGETWGPLHGLPMTVKESYDMVGTPTTWGIPRLHDNYPKRNALVVERFLGAGAVIFGKTNVPLHLSDWQSFNEIYGTTNNPWDLSRAPGGSSGGSAAALAAGLTALEAGSDIGASIRNPAHYCGVYGHKPTYGVVSPRGQALPGSVAPSDISVVGPMARSAADLDLALGIMAGPDDIDAKGWRLSLPPARKKSLAEFKVALMLDEPTARVDRAVQDRLQALADFLARRGAKVDDRARPEIDTAAAHALYIKLLRAATSTRQTDADFAGNQERAQALAPGDESYLARTTRANVLAHRDWLVANQERHRMRLKWAAFFEDYDLLLCPPAASAAFPHDQAGERHDRTILVDGAPVPATDQLFWAGFSCLVYLPSTVAPIGLTAQGLPVGVQIVGPQYGDRLCILFARLIEREYHAFMAPPDFA